MSTSSVPKRSADEAQTSNKRAKDGPDLVDDSNASVYKRLDTGTPSSSTSAFGKHLESTAYSLRNFLQLTFHL